MISIFDLEEMDDEELLSKIDTTLSTFPILKEIYDEDFLVDLVGKRFHYDNHLLWMLVCNHPQVTLIWETVSKYLHLLKDSDAISHFREKLRHRGERVFHSYLTELEMAGYYKEKGYEIELEPEILSSKKNPDFKVELDDFRVYFEIRNLFMDELMQMENLDVQIHGMFTRIDERFVFSIFYKPLRLQIKHLKRLQMFIKKSLAEANKTQNLHFPFTLFFPDKKNTLAEVEVWGRPKKFDHGYLAGLGTTFGIPQGSKNVRRKISKKISQLPKGEANVVVVEPGHLFYDVDYVVDALLGDVYISVNLKDHSTHAVRKGDRIFDAKKNTRLSAVIYYEKKFQNQKFFARKTVFHNPFAAKPIGPDFFEDEGVKQLVPIEEETSYRLEWI